MPCSTIHRYYYHYNYYFCPPPLAISKAELTVLLYSSFFFSFPFFFFRSFVFSFVRFYYIWSWSKEKESLPSWGYKRGQLRERRNLQFCHDLENSLLIHRESSLQAFTLIAQYPWWPLTQLTVLHVGDTKSGGRRLRHPCQAVFAHDCEDGVCCVWTNKFARLFARLGFDLILLLGGRHFISQFDLNIRKHPRTSAGGL